ncbi:response regulator transcription factor [Tsukamurella soli]|uniref:Two-component system response regulator PrrA n=1 Tax=Tsukamurella soli TaxID=644556 RepID=A0ABP8JQ22_9ACTN
MTIKSTVLVVDDDPDILASLHRGLSLSGFAVTTADSGADALTRSHADRVDAVVLDLNMPDLDGIGVITALRALGSAVPICVLSARTAIDDRIRSLEVGADDYLVKPFDLGELVARLRALIRRSTAATTPDRADPAPSDPEDGLACGPLTVDVAGRRAFVDGAEVDLTRREFDLLETLLRNRGIVLSRPRLLELVWGYDFAADTNVVDVFVGYVRRKLDGADAPALIHTVRGVGFVLRQS